MKKYKKSARTVSDEEVGKYEPILFSDVKKEWLKNPTFKKAYADLEPEYAIIRAVLIKRIAGKMSQKDLAKRLGTKQSAISRLESGNYNPTLSFLKKPLRSLASKAQSNGFGSE